MYKLGILGGMGPEATALFLERVLANTRADADDEHIPSVVLNNTLIPDRTAALLGEGECPVAALQEDIDTLAALGVEVIATPCNTAHAFLDRLVFPGHVTFVNMVAETLKVAGEEKLLAVLGTTGLNRVGVYERMGLHNRFLPLTDEEQTLTMDAITLVKAARHAEAQEKLLASARLIRKREPDVLFLLSCTELSVIRAAFEKEFSCIDALEVLARKTVEACDYPTKDVL
ncbi:MAG: amino acid racemase [Clostridia bacterium]|nr:amino acid racemase [Clostridia bacterium]